MEAVRKIRLCLPYFVHKLCKPGLPLAGVLRDHSPNDFGADRVGRPIDPLHRRRPVMKILAIDLGKFKNVYCLFDTDTGEEQIATIRSQPAIMADVLDSISPDRVVIEIGPTAGWVSDLVRERGIELQVANPNHEAWRWKSIKRKTDRDDAIKLAQLSSMNQLPQVVVPERRMRQWRILIRYRVKLVRRRTAIKNSIRSILNREGLSMPQRRSGWTLDSLADLRGRAKAISECDIDELWRGQLHLELEAFEVAEKLLHEVEKKLDLIGKQTGRVQLLQSTPGVGPRLAEALVAMIGDPNRFRNGKEVGAYFGLVPRQFESGTMSRHGKITCRGDSMVRALLIEVSWISLRFNDWARELYERISHGSKARRKTAIVAVARRLVIRCWAMLRDNRTWQPACSA